MPNNKLLECLNQALSIEYSAVIQYCQHSALVAGMDRKIYEDFFNASSEEARTHAKKVADWIVSLGGVPTIEAAHIKQSVDLEEMLKQDLETENQAVTAYREAHAAVEGDEPIKFMLEEQIILEQEDVWDIEKFLRLQGVKVNKKSIDLQAS